MQRHLTPLRCYMISSGSDGSGSKMQLCYVMPVCLVSSDDVSQPIAPSSMAQSVSGTNIRDRDDGRYHLDGGVRERLSYPSLISVVIVAEEAANRGSYGGSGGSDSGSLQLPAEVCAVVVRSDSNGTVVDRIFQPHNGVVRWVRV